MIRKVFAKKFKGIIWRLLVHEEKYFLAIESRDLDTKKTFFSVLDISKGEFLFNEKTFLEDADTHLAHISEDNLLLKLSNQSDSLESTGLISIDLYSAEIAWEKYNIAIQKFHDKALQVFDTRFHPRKFYWIDVRNSLTIPDPNSDEISHSAIIFPEQNFNFKFPVFIDSIHLEGGVHELVLNGLQIISFHERKDNKLKQKLIIYDEKEILLEEILIKNIQKLQPESFFILKNQLFYIRNKNEIVSYFV